MYRFVKWFGFLSEKIDQTMIWTDFPAFSNLLSCKLFLSGHFCTDIQLSLFWVFVRPLSVIGGGNSSAQTSAKIHHFASNEPHGEFAGNCQDVWDQCLETHQENTVDLLAISLYNYAFKFGLYLGIYLKWSTQIFWEMRVHLVFKCTKRLILMKFRVQVWFHNSNNCQSHKCQENIKSYEIIPLKKTCLSKP